MPFDRVVAAGVVARRRWASTRRHVEEQKDAASEQAFA